LATSGIIVILVGADPIRVFRAIAEGAFGSPYQVSVGLAKAAPYLLCSVGISLCFRANVINIGGEGQIALGGLAATWAALTIPIGSQWLAIPVGLAAGAACGMAWGAIAAILHITRRVHEVLITLMMNFVALLLVGEALSGSLGEVGSGFPQSPLIPQPYWLPTLWPGSRLHIGVLLAIAVAVGAQFLLWRTTYGFAIRSVGASRRAAAYAGISVPRTILMVMCVAGATAGIAGAVQVLGVHFRLIEGFSNGFGFVSVAIALLGAIDPLGQIPAALLFGFLETGTLAAQRQMGIPSSLVQVIEGIVMLSVLAAMGSMAQRRRV
jgi:simple sugar transport system permease protein